MGKEAVWEGWELEGSLGRVAGVGLLACGLEVGFAAAVGGVEVPFTVRAMGEGEAMVLLRCSRRA